VHRRWLILAVLFIARTAMGYQYQTVAATAPALLRELHVGFAEIGTLIGLYHISGVFLSLPGGLITRRLGDKNLCTISLGLMAGGGFLMGTADTYAVAFAGRLASGMGGTLFNLVLTKMTTDWFARREIVLAMAVILSTWPFGNALGLLTEPRIADGFGWRTVMVFAGALCLLSWLLITLCYRVPPPEEGSTADVGASAEKPGLPPWRVIAPVLAAGAMWGTFNAGFVAYFSFVPVFLTNRHGMAMADAGAMASLALWVGMVSIPFCGFIAQRIGRPFAVIVLFCSLAAASLALLVAGAPPFLACVAFGLAIGPPPGVITSLPSRVLQPDERASGFGVFYTCHFLLQASGPAIGGWLLDLHGSAAAVLLSAALFLAPLPLLLVFRSLAPLVPGKRGVLTVAG
jgi:predicted MFS family arabinose efflux permease